MKKLTITLIAITFTILGYGQINGVDFSTARVVKTDAALENEILMKVDSDYAITYAQTPVGIKHCMDKLGDIMSANGFTADNTFYNDILLASYVDGLLDYEGLCRSLRVGSSEVYIGWVKNGWVVGIVLSEKVFCIIFSKA